jgi:cytochrome c6
MNKLIASLFLAIMVIACAGKEPNQFVNTADGETIYKKYCILCHGVDGKLGLNGSKDLSVSQLTLDQRVVQVTKGKNTMTPYEGILSPQEIKAVAEYTLTLTRK